MRKHPKPKPRVRQANPVGDESLHAESRNQPPHHKFGRSIFQGQFWPFFPLHGKLAKKPERIQHRYPKTGRKSRHAKPDLRDYLPLALNLTAAVTS